MAAREKYVETKVCEHAKKLGWLVRKAQWIGRNGCPDRFFFRDGLLVIIEFKRPGGGALSDWQKKEIAELGAQGFRVHVVHEVDHGKAIFDGYEV